MSREKGKRGEREIVNALQEVVDNVCNVLRKERIVLQRNLLQSDIGGCDLHGLDWLSLEVKRQERANLSGWWSQTLEQTQEGQTPVLVWRQNHFPWRVRMNAEIRTCEPNAHAGSMGEYTEQVVDLDFNDAFLVWFEKRLTWEMKFGTPRKNPISERMKMHATKRAERATQRIVPRAALLPRTVVPPWES